MRKSIFRTFLFLLGLMLSGNLFAQESVLGTGGNASSADGSVSFSVGQIGYITSIGTQGSVAPGVQQPYEISVVSSTEEAKAIGLTASIFPNPTSEFVTLHLENISFSRLNYKVRGPNGQVLAKDYLTEKETSIYMNHLASGIYYLSVFDGNTKIKTFKIMKL